MSAADRVALAVFAKTPGRTPAKTRLAAGVGREAADRFYRLSVAATAAVVDAAALRGPVEPVFALAEPDAAVDPLWAGRRTTGQGTGGLGERLHAVYARLLAEFPAVLLIGCDSPHHTPADLLRPAAALLNPDDPADFRLGRCEDGGYWLLGGRRPVPRAAFLSVDYSAATTAAETAAALRPLGPVAEEPWSFDVDTADDLPRLRAALERLEEPSGPQRELLRGLSADGPPFAAPVR